MTKSKQNDHLEARMETSKSETRALLEGDTKSAIYRFELALQCGRGRERAAISPAIHATDAMRSPAHCFTDPERAAAACARERASEIWINHEYRVAKRRVQKSSLHLGISSLFRGRSSGNAHAHSITPLPLPSLSGVFLLLVITIIIEYPVIPRLLCFFFLLVRREMESWMWHYWF